MKTRSGRTARVPLVERLTLWERFRRVNPYVWDGLLAVAVFLGSVLAGSSLFSSEQGWRSASSAAAATNPRRSLSPPGADRDPGRHGDRGLRVSASRLRRWPIGFRSCGRSLYGGCTSRPGDGPRGGPPDLAGRDESVQGRLAGHARRSMARKRRARRRSGPQRQPLLGGRPQPRIKGQPIPKG